MGKAAALFYSDGKQTLHTRVTPTTEQRDYLQEQWNRLAEHLRANLREKHGYPISTWIQGSYKYGTLIRPIHSEDEYDVDIGIYFEWESRLEGVPSASDLRNWVQHELVAYKSRVTGIIDIVQPAKERCSRVIYASRFHIDTPVYHLTPDKGRRRLARLDGEWEDSDPKSIYKWFRDSFEGVQREQVRRVIRYLKGWAAVAFTSAPNSRPSSILVTVLVSEALVAEYRSRWRAMDDEVALTAVIRSIQSRLLKNAAVSNPVAKQENLNRINATSWSGFLVRLQALRDAADRAESADTAAGAALAWSDVFSFLMPLPKVAEIHVLEEKSGHTLMPIPDVKVRVLRARVRTQVAEHMNAVPKVAVGYRLEFSILNPTTLPESSIIEWTVRYCGEDDGVDGALGRRIVGVDMSSATEVTDREGAYSMDCVIRVNGSVYAARRVPFHVIGSIPRSPSGQAVLGIATVTRPALKRT
jgi:hypothetical protein